MEKPVKRYDKWSITCRGGKYHLAGFTAHNINHSRSTFEVANEPLTSLKDLKAESKSFYYELGKPDQTWADNLLNNHIDWRKLSI